MGLWEVEENYSARILFHNILFIKYIDIIETVTLYKSSAIHWEQVPQMWHKHDLVIWDYSSHQGSSWCPSTIKVISSSTNSQHNNQNCAVNIFYFKKKDIFFS